MIQDNFATWEIIQFDCTDSTNKQAVAMAKEGCKRKLAIIADSQTAGRGRFDRKWLSPPNCNLYLSLTLFPEFKPEKTPLVSLLTPVAVVEAINDMFKLDAKIKWPNDILIAKNKVAGILIELSTFRDTVRYIVVGIGINLNMQIAGNKEIPKGIAITSIKQETGKNTNRRLFLKALLDRFDKWYAMTDKPQDIISAWKKYADTLGRFVSTSEVAGTAVDITPSGHIIIETSPGIFKPISSGELLHIT